MPTYEVPVRMVTEGKAIIEADNAGVAEGLVWLGEYEDFFEDKFGGYIEVTGPTKEIVE